MSDRLQQPLWSGRPAQGLVWRPQDLGYTIVFALVGGTGLFIVGRASWLGLVLWLGMLTYLLAGRFFHDAWLRSEIDYRLSKAGLEIWRVVGTAPTCVIELHRLTNLKPLFVTASGRGTIELPPGEWASRPEWVNRWDRLVPALYPCRRLEMLDDVKAAAAIIREQATLLRYGTAKPPVVAG